MRKPQDWGQPCPNPDCSHYRLIYRGNLSAIAPSLTQSGTRRLFRCGKCEGTFSATRDTVFFDLRTPEEKGIMALKMLLVTVALSDIIAYFWDERLPIEERLQKASAPAAWPQLGRQVIFPGR